MSEAIEGLPVARRPNNALHWNYRVIEFADPKTGEAWRAIHEVHYENGEPVAYAEPHASVVWDAADSGTARPLQILAQMAGALDRPVLVERDFKRPNETANRRICRQGKTMNEEQDSGRQSRPVEATVGLLERIAGECFQQAMLGGTTRERKLAVLLSESAAEIQKLRNALDHYAHGGSEYGRVARDALGMQALLPNAVVQPRAEPKA